MSGRSARACSETESLEEVFPLLTQKHDNPTLVEVRKVGSKKVPKFFWADPTMQEAQYSRARGNYRDS